MAISYVFAGIATAHYAAALPWYERLFGRAPDMLPQDGEAAWQLTETGWIYLVGDAVRAGKGLLTLLADEQGGLARQGVDRRRAMGQLK